MNRTRDRQTILRRMTAMLLILCLVCSHPVPAMAETAATLKLQKTEGTVRVFGNSGKSLSVIQNMSLYNGYQVATDQASYAWINLDNAKLTKLDAVSELELRKKGKELELLLNAGNLYFNITEPLAEDETLNIRTSSMVMGIRGTAGWVKVVDRWHTLVYMLEGTLQCIVTDPVSGQSKQATLSAGDLAEVVVYDKNKEGDKCDIFLRRYTEQDIDGFVLVELVQDATLCQKIYEASGLDILPHADRSQRQLLSDQSAMARKLENINAQIGQQDNHISVDPVWADNTDHNSSFSGGSGGGGGGGGGGSSSRPPAMDEPTTEAPGNENPVTPQLRTENLTMPVTAQQVHDTLQDDQVGEVVLVPSGNPASDTLNVDVNVQVPAGKTLTLEDGVGMETQNGTTLQIDGTLNTAGDVTSQGTINNTSSNTFRIGGTLANQASGTINNTRSGRIIASGGITNLGTFTNDGTVEGVIRTSGTLTLANGETGVITQTGGEVTIRGGAAGGVTLDEGTLSLYGGTAGGVTQNGGTLNLGGGDAGGLTQNGGNIQMNGGTMSEALTVENGSTLELNGGNLSKEVDVAAGGALVVSGGNFEKEINVAEGASLTVDGGKLSTVKADGGQVVFEGGEAQKVTQTGGTLTVSNAKSIGEIEGNQAVLDISGGTVGKVTQNDGTLAVSGAKSVQEVIQAGGTADISGGTVQKVTQQDGTLEISGGTVKEVTQENGGLTVSNGTVTSITQESGSLTVSGGTVSEISGNQGDVTVAGGRVSGITQEGGSLTVSGGTVSGIFGNQGTVTVTGGTVTSLRQQDGQMDISNGKVSELRQQGGGSVISGGSIGSAVQQDGTAVLSGGEVTDGYTVQGDASMVMDGGVIRAGSADAALTVDAEMPGENKDEMLDLAFLTPNVDLKGGIIDGKDKHAIDHIKGELFIRQDTRVTAAEAYDLLQISEENYFETNGNWKEISRVTHLKRSGYPGFYGQVLSEGMFADSQDTWWSWWIYPQDIFTCRRTGADALYLTHVNDGIDRALGYAEGGEIVTVRADSPADSPYQEYGTLLVTAGDEASPVELDLNGRTLTVELIEIGERPAPGSQSEAAGALAVYDRRGGSGSLEVAGAIDNFAGSYLRLENATYRGTFTLDSEAFIRNQGHLEIQDGAVVEAENTGLFLIYNPYSIADSNYGHESYIEIGTDGVPVVLRGSNVSNSLIYLGRYEMPAAGGMLRAAADTQGVSLILDSVEITANEACALAMDDGVSVLIRNGAKLISESPYGTILGIGFPNIRFVGGASIINDSSKPEHPALSYELGGLDLDGQTFDDWMEKEFRPQILDQVNAGAKYQAGNEDVIMWTEYDGGHVSLRDTGLWNEQERLVVKDDQLDSQGYYYAGIEKRVVNRLQAPIPMEKPAPENIPSSSLATPSQIDPILDEDLWDEEEEKAGGAHAGLATPSQAARIESDDFLPADGAPDGDKATAQDLVLEDALILDEDSWKEDEDYEDEEDFENEQDSEDDRDSGKNEDSGIGQDSQEQGAESALMPDETEKKYTGEPEEDSQPDEKDTSSPQEDSQPDEKDTSLPQEDSQPKHKNTPMPEDSLPAEGKTAGLPDGKAHTEKDEEGDQ